MADNSIENFWKAGDVAPIQNPDRNTWTTDPSSTEAQSQPATTSAEKPRNCVKASDCSSGHICIDGDCVERSRSTSGQAGSSGCSSSIPGTTGDGNPGGGNTEAGATGGSGASGGCATQGCVTATCGSGQPGEVDCCGGLKYKRYDAYSSTTWSCDPPPEPSGRGSGSCNSYCTNYLHVHGVYASGCSTRNTCPMCKDCGFGSNFCTDRSDAPCHCRGSECRGDCEECNDEGDCEENCDKCFDVCSCSVTCPCGVSLAQDGYARPHCDNGPACASACRSDLKSRCSEHCEELENRDPCTATDVEACAGNCVCVTWVLPCGVSVSDTCPAGHTCESLGTLGMASCYDENGACVEGCKITHFVKKCDTEAIPEECEECDCNCENDCPDCYVCNASGECEPDPECDETCDEADLCDGSCCGDGEECAPSVEWKVAATCHGSEPSFFAPPGVKPKLVQFATITKEQAVCDRWHTHCYIQLGCVQTNIVTLDCKKQLVRVGEGPRMCWSQEHSGC